MSDLFEPIDATDARLALGAAGLLGAFNAAGVLTSADVHVAAALGRLGRESDERVLLAVALAVRAVRGGSVCVDLATVADPPDLPWPAADDWSHAVAASPLVTAGNKYRVRAEVVNRTEKGQWLLRPGMTAAMTIAP